jgi:lysophospholipase L1-like esterase
MDFGSRQLPTDFGDAPDSYSTTLVTGGARHSATGPTLGTNRDSESDGVPSADANSDDTTGTLDDEDGVTFATDLIPGENGIVAVTASGPGELSFWIDFDQNGTFDDATERFMQSFLTSGSLTIPFAVPASAALGRTYARFRFSTAAVVDPTGWAPDGEVEDYGVTIKRTSEPLRIGVIGDSLSDEYAEQGFGYARNWVELLVDVKGIDFGTTGAWGEPRRDGYEYNWACAGATSTTMLESGQHTSVAQQLQDGAVDYAVLAIGQNDFDPWAAAYVGVYMGTWTERQIDAYVAQVVSNIETALQTLDAAGGKVVLANVIDYGVAPATRQLFPDPSKRELVADVLRRVNRELRKLAQEYEVPLVDGFQATKDLLGTNQQPATTLLIGGATPSPRQPSRT